MTLVLLVVLVLSTGGAFFLFDRQNARHARQVADLCQRLQAPQAAQYALIPSVNEGPMHLPYDDDEAFQEYVSDVQN